MNRDNKSLFINFHNLSEDEQEEFFNVNGRDLNKCTAKQRAYIYGLLDKAGMEEYDLIVFMGFCDYDSIKEFTIDEAGDSIDYLKSVLGY